MASEIINSISWKTLEHAYGSAENAPQAFEDLQGDDKDARDDAVNEFLLSSAIHQYTTYSCTPYVVRCVLDIIRNGDIEALESIGAPLVRELFGFINACTPSANNDNTLRNEIINGLDCYQEYLDHHDRKTAKIANVLLKFCIE